MGDYSNTHFLFSFSLQPHTPILPSLYLLCFHFISCFHFAAKAILLSNKCFGHEQLWVTRSSPMMQKFINGLVSVINLVSGSIMNLKLIFHSEIQFRKNTKKLVKFNIIYHVNLVIFFPIMRTEVVII